MSKLLFAAMAFMLLAVQPATVNAAPPVNEAGAAEIKKIIEDMSSFHLMVAERTGEGFSINGPITVTPMGDYYEARLPDTRAKALGIGELAIGTIVINISYGKKDTEYLVSMALPSPMVFTSADGGTSDIRIGNQRFAGAWEKELMTFTRIDSEYGDLVMTAAGDMPFALTIEKLGILLNLSRNSNGTWSGPNDVSFNDMQLIVPATEATGEFAVKVGSLLANGTYDEVNIKRTKELQQAIKEAIAAVEDPYEADISAVTRDILSSSESIFNGVYSKSELKDLSIVVNPTPNKPESKKKSFHLASLSSVVNVEGIKSNRGNMSFLIGLKGLNVDLGEPSEVVSYIPTEANMELYLDSLPMSDLKRTFNGVLESLFNTMTADEAAVAQGARPQPKQFQKSQVMAAAMAVPQMLSSAGTRFSIKNTYIKTPTIDSKLDGNFTANEAARYIAIGDMTLVLTGLDEMIMKLQTSSDSRMAQKAMGGLGMLQLMGQQDTGPGGKSTRTYKLQITGEGKVTLNGNDLSGMAGMMPR